MRSARHRYRYNLLGVNADAAIVRFVPSWAPGTGVLCRTSCGREECLRPVRLRVRVETFSGQLAVD